MRLISSLCALAFALPPACAADGDAVRLFNGKDLSGWYVFLKGLGRNNDPDKVFTVQDGVLRVSGQHWGGLTTEKDYENYHLVVEFKWGDKTWPNREKNARDSGILLHGVGEDGAYNGTWLESVECQMIEGGTGDFILVSGKNKPRMTAEVEQLGNQFYYKKGVPARQFPPGRINWWGRDPEWKDVKGFRGKRDVEKPVGEWNTVECVCDGDTITNILNGEVVNVGTQSSHTRGRITLQTEGAEVFFRKVELKPLKK